MGGKAGQAGENSAVQAAGRSFLNIFGFRGIKETVG